MIKKKELLKLLADVEKSCGEPYTTLLRPDKDYVIDVEILEDILTELHLRRIGNWESYVRNFG